VRYPRFIGDIWLFTVHFLMPSAITRDDMTPKCENVMILFCCALANLAAVRRLAALISLAFHLLAVQLSNFDVKYLVKIDLKSEYIASYNYYEYKLT